jgi:hypothetical protein
VATRYWFSPYGTIVPRDPQRGHTESVALPDAEPGPERAEELLHLDQGPPADGVDRDRRDHLDDQ